MTTIDDAVAKVADVEFKDIDDAYDTIITKLEAVRRGYRAGMNEMAKDAALTVAALAIKLSDSL